MPQVPQPGGLEQSDRLRKENRGIADIRVSGAYQRIERLLGLRETRVQEDVPEPEVCVAGFAGGGYARKRSFVAGWMLRFRRQVVRVFCWAGCRKYHPPSPRWEGLPG